MATTSINCPKCNHRFNVEEVLLRQVEEKHREELKLKITEMEQSFQEKETALKERERLLESEREAMERTIEEKAKAETAAREEKLKKRIAEDFEVQIQALTESENAAKEKLAALKATQLENAKLKRQLDEQKQDLEIEFEKKLAEKLHTRTEEIRRQEKEGLELVRQREKDEMDLKIRELEKKLEDQTKLAAEMKRKAEQGSMQLQGEVQELALEEMLRDLYEREGDEIAEIKKGQRGADVLHTVKTRLGEDCGKIYYESKRTQTFNNEWLQKLRDDNITVGADILVLVTETMPPGQNRCFLKDKVWVCTLGEVKALSLVFREGICRVYEARVIQSGRESKTEQIYDYLTSQEFAGHFGAIIEGFKALQHNYVDEKTRMEKIWKEREKQLDKVLRNAARFYGSIQGIAGQSIPEVKLFADSVPLLEKSDES